MISQKINHIKQVFRSRSQLFQKERSLLKQQQQIIFLFYALAVFTGLVANLFGLTGPQTPLMLTLNFVFLAIVLLLGLLHFFHKISLVHTFCAMAVTAQVFTCNELLLCAIHPSDYHLMLIIANMFLLIANVLFTLIAYLKNTSYALVSMSIVTYAACTYITNDDILRNFCVLVIMLFVLVAILSKLLTSNFQRLTAENERLHKEEQEILNVLRMEKEQVKAYVRLAKERHQAPETEKLLALLGENAQENVIKNVKEVLTIRDIELHPLTTIFPELSPSELDICRLAILGKTLKETCDILNKSESNITCQRVNIRKKLGLVSGDNLNIFLLNRFEQGKIAQDLKNA